MIDERNRDPRLPPPARGLTMIQIALIIAGLLIAAFAIWTFAGTRRANPDQLPDAANSSAAARPFQPERSCGSQATYDLIKSELFRRAAALRGSDQATFDKLAGYAVVRVDRPLLDSEDEQTKAIRCSGSLTLDLPPGVAVVGGRRSLVGDIGYALQPSADGNGQVLTLTNADSIITPLATLARVANAAVPPLAPAADPLAPVSPRPLPPEAQVGPPPGSRAPTPPPAPTSPPAPSRPAPPTFAGRPSFSCASARTRGELAVCGDSGLAALDRQMAAQYVDALRGADPRTRAELQRSGERFLAYRDQCPSDACIAQTYRGRMREIRDIADGGFR